MLQAYLSVAPQVAGFAPYRPALVEHLMHIKLQHWERSLRELSAQALAALVPAEQGYFQGPALEALLPRCLDPMLEVRLLLWESCMLHLLVETKEDLRLHTSACGSAAKLGAGRMQPSPLEFVYTTGKIALESRRPSSCERAAQYPRVQPLWKAAQYYLAPCTEAPCCLPSGNQCE